MIKNLYLGCLRNQWQFIFINVLQAAKAGFFQTAPDILVGKGGDKMSDIKCTVEECIYNDREHCKAKAIEVRSSQTLNVSCPDETACETFSER
jgi:hypothetical protein